MEYCCIKPRHGSEAIKTQWINAEERRAKAATAMSTMSKTLTQNGKHSRQGKTKENCEWVRNIAKKLKKSSSFHRQEVAKKCIETRKKLFREHPERHSCSSASPTKAEGILLNYIQQSWPNATHNHYIPHYWIDIFVPELSLGIECCSYGRFPLQWERHVAITNSGIHLIYITNRQIYRRNFSDLDDYIIRFNGIPPYPSPHSQDTVIWGHRNRIVFDGQPDKITVKRIFVNRCHRLELSASPHDSFPYRDTLYGFPT
jgi:hypothetical protein